MKNGFASLILIGLVLLLAIGGFVTWIILGSNNTPLESSPADTYTNEDQEMFQDNKEQSRDVRWQFTETWVALGTPPSCPDPLVLTSPVDLAKVNSVLYPGQERGGDYKAHGGFRFNVADAVTVKAPMDATLVSGSRYIEQGEVQYLLFFVNPCGIAYRFDHLLTLSSEMQKVANTLPQAKVDDTRTTHFNNPRMVKKGDTIATAVGFPKTQNISVDFGVYDLRKQNAASANASFAQKYANRKEQAFYGVCWFDWLSKENSEKVKSLPAADQANGKTSDYCK